MSEVSRGISVDEEKENRSAHPRRDFTETLGMWNTGRQRQCSWKRPIFYNPGLKRASKSEDFNDFTPELLGIRIASKSCPLESLQEEMTLESMSSNDFMDEEVMKVSPTGSPKVE